MIRGQLTAAIDVLESQSYRLVVNLCDITEILKKYADIEGERLVGKEGDKTSLNFATQLDLIRGESMALRDGLTRLRVISEDIAIEEAHERDISNMRDERV